MNSLKPPPLFPLSFLAPLSPSLSLLTSSPPMTAGDVPDDAAGDRARRHRDVDGGRRPLQGLRILQDLRPLPLGKHPHLYLARQVHILSPHKMFVRGCNFFGSMAP